LTCFRRVIDRLFRRPFGKLISLKRACVFPPYSEIFTPTFGQSGFTGQTEQRGFRAMQNRGTIDRSQMER